MFISFDTIHERDGDDNFFTQHVTIPTRNDAILDLVITNEPDMIFDLIDLGPFPGSDHKSTMHYHGNSK